MDTYNVSYERGEDLTQPSGHWANTHQTGPEAGWEDLRRPDIDDTESDGHAALPHQVKDNK